MLGINSGTLSAAIPAREKNLTPAHSVNTLSTVQSEPNSQIISSLAGDLSTIALYAASRERSSSPDQLRQYAITVLTQISEAYSTHKNRDDAEQPADSTQERLLRAQQATDFVNGKNSNPFHAMPRDQLTLIAFDTSRIFTVNERKCAWQEVQRLDNHFQRQLTSEALVEYESSGKLTQAASNALKHFEGLTSIEKSLYPSDFLARLRSLATAETGTPLRSEAASSIKPDSTWIRSLLFPEQDQLPATPPREPAALTKNAEGYQVMIKRLFGEFEPNYISPAETGTISSMYRPDVHCITREDRVLLSNLYVYAQAQGADLRYVDDLAREIGVYRRHLNGTTLLSMNTGGSYDSSGRQRSVRFTPESAAAASRILDSKAFKSTLLDKGFLRFATNPGYLPYSPTSDLDFVEQLVKKFSGESDEATSLDKRFAMYPEGRRSNKIISVSETIRLAPGKEPHLIRDHDIWIITPRGKAAGYVMDPISGTPMLVKPTARNDNENEQKSESKPSHALDGFFDKPGKKRSLLTPFNLWFMKYKLQGRVRRP